MSGGTGFSADWLALRREADRRARDAGLAARLAERFAAVDRLRVLDLGAGTGAMLGWMSPRLGAGQHWLLADADAALLARAAAPPEVAVERRTVDLAGDLAPLFEPRPDLVTASAFFDLCSAAWTDRLVRHVAAAGACLYAVLTYDGRERWEPAHRLDTVVLHAFHAHQRSDKGFGPALGPDAPAHLGRALAAAGYEVLTAPSDWRLAAPADAALIAALAEGSAAAVAPAIGRAAASDWQISRARAAGVTVGHIDILALPRRPH